MANIWYPVIDYSACIACGSCVKKCSHGVYNVGKAPTPVVVNPGGCVDHCHGCGTICPAGAITYVGEDTGWTPPNGAPSESESACACGSERDEKTVLVEYLYLDLKTCDRCVGAELVLEEVLETLSPALALAGYTVCYRKIEMSTQVLAMEHRFVASPTIRVNGRDICASVAENDCGCCGEISGTQVDCRVFTYGEETFEVPPKAMLAEGILSIVFGGGAPNPDGGYALPENLANFYLGKEQKTGCNCGAGCCG